MESETASKGDSFQQPEVSHVTSTKWQRVHEVIWDDPRSKDEKRLVQRLDLFVLSWATFGYFVRLLDSSNVTNAYVSGMKGDLNFEGNQYNLLQTFFTCGYLVGQVLSQFLLTRVYQINLFPTAALAVGLVTTLLYAWLTDGLEKRWQVLLIPAIINLIGMIMVAVGSTYALTFAGYLIDAASWGFWPVLYAWAIEIMHKNMEERAVVIGIAQTLVKLSSRGSQVRHPRCSRMCMFVLNRCVSVVTLDVGKYAPSFHMGFSIMCGVSVLELSRIFLIKYFEEREKAKEERESLSV
ncbi:Pantothenate transporter liz1 [Colletotrichum viniferum]|nr:Pantothenate transporter liz1 [Colletotrichum viniferum]